MRTHRILAMTRVQSPSPIVLVTSMLTLTKIPKKNKWQGNTYFGQYFQRDSTGGKVWWADLALPVRNLRQFAYVAADKKQNARTPS